MEESSINISHLCDLCDICDHVIHTPTENGAKIVIKITSRVQDHRSHTSHISHSKVQIVTEREAYY